MQTAHDKYLACNSLIGIIRACVGKWVQIDLRNENHVYGRIVSVFGEMNVIMRDASLISQVNVLNKTSSTTKTTKTFSELTIRGRNIRFVHIPDDIDMISAIEHSIFSTTRQVKKNEFKKRPRQQLTN